jgi:hypothetical protein
MGADACDPSPELRGVSTTDRTLAIACHRPSPACRLQQLPIQHHKFALVHCAIPIRVILGPHILPVETFVRPNLLEACLLLHVLLELPVRQPAVAIRIPRVKQCPRLPGIIMPDTWGHARGALPLVIGLPSEGGRGLRSGGRGRWRAHLGAGLQCLLEALHDTPLFLG